MSPDRVRRRLPLAWRRRLAVFAGGVLGGGARIAVSAVGNGGDGIPWGTAVANVSGALLLGYLLTRFLQAGSRTTLTIPLLCTGVLGSYTTFSTFSLEAWELLDAGRAGLAAGYALGSVVAGAGRRGGGHPGRGAAPMIVLAAMLGSGVGALARYGVAGMVQRRHGGTRPWGTATVNVGGALLLGVLAGLHAAGRLDGDLLTIVGTGFCGGFTTFSTWMVESVRLGEEGAAAGLLAAGVNLGAMLVVGIAAAALAVTLVG